MIGQIVLILITWRSCGLLSLDQSDLWQHQLVDPRGHGSRGKKYKHTRENCAFYHANLEKNQIVASGYMSFW